MFDSLSSPQPRYFPQHLTNLSLTTYTYSMTVSEQLNRSEIARKTGLHLSAISRFLSGDRVPNFKQAKVVADAMGVSLDDLYQLLYK